MRSFRRLTSACYMTNITMAVVGNISPVLFLTFRELYGVSFSLLGLLVLINFCTQLGIDLIFSFFSHKFNIPLTVRLTPVIAVAGLCVYALGPLFCPTGAYVFLVLGTVISAAASGLAEVLISPLIAAVPAEDPDRQMSKLHSIYAWGVVFVIIFATLFLLCFGHQSWHYLALLLAVIPLAAAWLFAGAVFPQMQTPEHTADALRFFKNRKLWLSVIGIFLGGAAECTMAQWASGYLETAVGLPKAFGDILGVAMFSVMLGLGRTTYARRGRNPQKVLFWGAVSGSICYLLAALTPLPVVGLIACALTGLCVSMMWPGSLVIAEHRFPQGGVFIFAVMAAGGDLGAAFGPQLVGIVTDAALLSPKTLALAELLSITPEALGLKLGMLVGMLFPLFAIFVYGRLKEK